MSEQKKRRGRPPKKPEAKPATKEGADTKAKDQKKKDNDITTQFKERVKQIQDSVEELKSEKQRILSNNVPKIVEFVNQHIDSMNKAVEKMNKKIEKMLNTQEPSKAEVLAAIEEQQGNLQQLVDVLNAEKSKVVSLNVPKIVEFLSAEIEELVLDLEDLKSKAEDIKACKVNLTG